MLKIVVLVSFFLCFASSEIFLNSKVPISLQINGIEVNQIDCDENDIPPEAVGTENVVYAFGKRLPGEELIASWCNGLEEAQEFQSLVKIPAVGNDSGCVIRALKLVVGQYPNVDQAIRIVAGGFGQRFLHFELKYRNMTRSFDHIEFYGNCDSLF